MTRKQLAAASGTSERYLALLEAGVGNPSLAVLCAIADALDVSIADLIPQSGERDPIRARLYERLRRLPTDQLLAMIESLQSAAADFSGKDRRIALIGLRGAGKSSLGQALARHLRVPFVEMSAEVEKLYGASIGMLIELKGQGTLKHYETQAWEIIRARHAAAVIAASGGIVANPPLYDRILSSAHCIWLQASPNDHMERVVRQGDFRPMARNRSAMTDLKAILDARSVDYARADAELDTSEQGFEETLELLDGLARTLLQQPPD